MTPFLTLVARDLLRRFSGDMSRLTVVFPNKRASLFLNDYMATESRQPVWAPAYSTISELFRSLSPLSVADPIETVCGRYGGGVKLADWYYQGRRRLTPRQTALLRRLAAGLQGEDLEDMNQILVQFAS